MNNYKNFINLDSINKLFKNFMELHQALDNQTWNLWMISIFSVNSQESEQHTEHNCVVTVFK